MLFPYGSDAPLYHIPIMTGVMILLNILAFVGIAALGRQMDEEQFEFIVNQLILQYGTWKPWQWVTSNFMHGGIMHLLGNMFCLWGFGIVVEGKIGWWRFLLVFFGIGIAQSGVEQTLMLFADEGGSLGASAIIYGLLAMCVVWAPENEMNCFLILGFRPIVCEIKLYTLGIGALLIELFTGFLAGMSMGSQVLHLMGGGLGFGVGVLMLKRGWVDCEGWDLFSVWTGTQNKAREEEMEAARKIVSAAQQKVLDQLVGAEDKKVAAHESLLSADDLFQTTASLTEPVDRGQTLAKMREAIAAGDPQTAYGLFEQLADDPFATDLPEAELLKIISLFQKQKLWSASMPAMVKYLQNFQAKEPQIRVLLAKILVQVEKRPGQALAVLEKLNESQLKAEDRQAVAQLRSRAEHLQAEQPDAMEMLEDW